MKYLPIALTLFTVGCIDETKGRSRANQFVIKMGLDGRRLGCDRVPRGWLVCNSVTGSGYPAAFNCDEESCWWRTGQ